RTVSAGIRHGVLEHLDMVCCPLFVCLEACDADGVCGFNADRCFDVVLRSFVWHLGNGSAWSTVFVPRLLRILATVQSLPEVDVSAIALVILRLSFDLRAGDVMGSLAACLGTSSGSANLRTMGWSGLVRPLPMTRQTHELMQPYESQFAG